VGPHLGEGPRVRSRLPRAGM